MRCEMEGLIGAANEADFRATPRLVQDWVGLGLLDRPERHGLGRGKGTSATWSDEQRGLFVTLLGWRKEVTRVGPLCNIPVWTWLYFGDTCVPLRQVRRALGTWGGWTTKVSWTTAKRAARQMLDGVGHPRARRADKQAFVDAAAAMFLHLPEKFDQDALLPLLKPIFDPKDTGLSRTLGGMELTPEASVAIVKARLRALMGLAADEADDSLFHWARFANIVARAQYQSHLARMSTPDASAGMANVPGIDQAYRACPDLLTLLGLGLDNPGDAASLSLDHPAAWRVRNLRTSVRGELIEGEVNVTVEVREEEKLEHKRAGQ